RFMSAGVDSLLGKPFRMAELYGKIAELNLHPLANPPPKPPVAPAAAEELDLLARVGGDTTLLGTMIKTFLRDSLRKLSEMKRGLARKNAIALAAAAHALKGSASIFGSRKATQCAQKLQDMGRSDNLAGASVVLRELEEEIALLHEKLRGYGPAGSRAARKSVRRNARSRPNRAKRKT
ncbi:MAG: Hpt domain-containing protein, partial [Candidatus Acidiferrum sp.]